MPDDPVTKPTVVCHGVIPLTDEWRQALDGLEFVDIEVTATPQEPTPTPDPDA
jgi:hypothetical protein